MVINLAVLIITCYYLIFPIMPSMFKELLKRIGPKGLYQLVKLLISLLRTARNTR